MRVIHRHLNTYPQVIPKLYTGYTQVCGILRYIKVYNVILGYINRIGKYIKNLKSISKINKKALNVCKNHIIY